MIKAKRLLNLLRRKRLNKIEFVLLIVLAIFIYGSLSMRGYFAFDLNQNIQLENPWKAVQDSNHNTYVVDQERSRILKINAQNKVDRIIKSDTSNPDTFYYIEDLELSDDNELYLLDTGWSMRGFSVESERILQYDTEGHYIKTLYTKKYDDNYNDKHRIFGMKAVSDGLYYVYADEDGFDLYYMSLNQTQNAPLSIRHYDYEDAITFIQDFAIDSSTLEVYGIDKRGLIIKGSLDNELTLLFDGRETKELNPRTTFYHIECGHDQNLYITDIAFNRLLKWDNDNQALSTYADGFKNWTVSYHENNIKHVLLATGQDGLNIFENDQLIVGRQNIFSMTRRTYSMKCAYWLITCLATILSLYFVLRILGIISKIQFSVQQKSGILLAAIIIIVISIVVNNLLAQFEMIYRNELMNKLTMSAQTVSNTIDKSALVNIENSQQFMNDDYRQLIQTMNLAIDKRFEYNNEVYCNLMRYDGEKAYAIVYQDQSIGTYYPLESTEANNVMRVYETGEIIQSDVVSETGAYIFVNVPIMDEQGKIIGVVQVGTLDSVLSSKISNLSRMSIVPVMLIILVLMFLLSEGVAYFDLKSKELKMVHTDVNQYISYSRLRVIIFIVFLAFNMATTFLPVYVTKTVINQTLLPAEIIASLPLSINLVFIGVSSLFCSKLMQKFGFLRLAAISAYITMVGDIILSLSSTYWFVMMGLILNGIGVGLITNSIHIYIAGLNENDSTNVGFSIFNAASLSGINVGMVIGATFAEKVGQNSVFIISACIWLVLFIVFMAWRKNNTMTEVSNQYKENEQKRGWIFMLNWKVILFVLLMQAPYIVMNAFNYYFVPIFGDARGFTETEICLLMMVSPLFSVYLSVSLSTFLSDRLKSKTLYLSSAMVYMGLMIFAFNQSLWSIILALSIIGIANSFGASERINYFLKMNISQNYGEENAMGVYNFLDNIGESIGPIIFSSIYSIGTLVGSIVLVGVSSSFNAIYGVTQLMYEKIKHHNE